MGVFRLRLYSLFFSLTFFCTVPIFEGSTLTQSEILFEKYSTCSFWEGLCLGALEPAAGVGSDLNRILTPVPQHLLLWPGHCFRVWRGALVVLLAYPSVRLIGFMVQPVCLTGFVSVSDSEAFSFSHVGKRTQSFHTQRSFDWIVAQFLAEWYFFTWQPLEKALNIGKENMSWLKIRHVALHLCYNGAKAKSDIITVFCGTSVSIGFTLKRSRCPRFIFTLFSCLHYQIKRYCQLKSGRKVSD